MEGCSRVQALPHTLTHCSHQLPPVPTQRNQTVLPPLPHNIPEDILTPKIPSREPGGGGGECNGNPPKPKAAFRRSHLSWYPCRKLNRIPISRSCLNFKPMRVSGGIGIRRRSDTYWERVWVGNVAPDPRGGCKGPWSHSMGCLGGVHPQPSKRAAQGHAVCREAPETVVGTTVSPRSIPG